MKELIFLLVLLGGSFKTSAQTTLAWYGFDVSTMAPTSFNSSLVTASSLSVMGAVHTGYASGVTIGGADTAAYFNNWPVYPQTFDAGKYLEVTITANVGKSIDVNNLRFWIKRYGFYHPWEFYLRSSNDYNSNLFYDSQNSQVWSQYSINTPGINISNGSCITFRFYAGGQGSNDYFSGIAIDSLFIEGSEHISTLPIELASFEAHNVSDGVRLDWITASEQNNDHFVVERSDDARNFQVVTEVSGAGNSQQMLHYSIIDRDVTSGWYYYRLSQFDHDSQSEVFDNKVVPIYVNRFRELLFPNPANVGEAVHLPTDSQIIDPSGRLIHYDVDSFTPEISGVYIVGKQRLVVE